VGLGDEIGCNGASLQDIDNNPCDHHLDKGGKVHIYLSILAKDICQIHSMFRAKLILLQGAQHGVKAGSALVEIEKAMRSEKDKAKYDSQVLPRCCPAVRFA
jgi:hypothetical protein